MGSSNAPKHPIAILDMFSCSQSPSIAGRGFPVAVFALLLTVHGPAVGQGPGQNSLPDGLTLTVPDIPQQVTGAMRPVNVRLSQNLTPADNAVVFLTQTFGADAFDPKLRQASLQMLGIKNLSDSAPRFVFLEGYVQSQGASDPGTIRNQALVLQEKVFAAAQRPWRTEDFPGLDEYLSANAAALNAISAAADKPRYYAPMLSAESPADLISASLVIERRLPFIAKMLACRAMRSVAADDVPSAAADLLSCHKLAHLLAAGSPFDVSTAKAMEIDGVAARAEFAMLGSGKLTGSQATTYRAALERLPAFPWSAVAADVGERAVLHEQIEQLKSDDEAREDFFQFSDEDQPRVAELLSKIKWDLAIQRTDEIQDQVVRALSIRDRQAQRERFNQLIREHEEWNATADARTEQIAKSIKDDADAASRFIGESMAMSLRPIFKQRRMSDDRVCARRDLARVGLALVSFQRDRKEFPAELAELSPKYLNAVPVDAQTDAPFLYKRMAQDRAHLTSLGDNRTYDAGQYYNDDIDVEVR